MTAFCRTPTPDTAAVLGSVVDLGRNVNTARFDRALFARHRRVRRGDVRQGRGRSGVGVLSSTRGCPGLGWLDTGVASEELDFPLDDVIEGDTTVVDVVVPASAAVKLRSGCAFGHCECGTDRCLRVVFGDDEQDQDADVAGTKAVLGALRE
jgi:hypothetical protein